MSKTECAQNQKMPNTYGYGIRHVQMLIMCLAIIVLFTGRGCMSVAILAMTDVNRRNDTGITIYDWDKKTQSMILSSFFWGYMVMQIPGGILAKRCGGKIIILFALLSNATLSLLLPLIAQMGWYMVCGARLLMGMTQACIFPSTHTLLGKWLPTNERTALAGFVYGGIQLGTIAAMPLSGVLAETSHGWKLIYYTTATIMFFVAALWHWLSASSPAEHRMITVDEINYINKGLNRSSTISLRVPWMEILRSKPVWAIVFAHVAGGIVFMLFFVDLPTYLEKGLNISLTKVL